MNAAQVIGGGGPGAGENPQAAAAAAASGSKLDPNDPMNNRYLKDLKDIQNSAAFGVNVQDLLKAKSGGKQDYTKDIQFSIRKEFFTFNQYVQGMYWSLTIGMVIGAFTIAYLGGLIPDLFDFGGTTGMFWGVLLVTFGLADMLTATKAHGNIKHCTTKNKKDPKTGKPTKEPLVDPEYQGRDCFTDWDCTRKATVTKGVCKFPEPNAFSKWIKKVVSPMIMIGGAILTAITFSATNKRMKNYELAQAIMFGLGFGNFFALLFS